MPFLGTTPINSGKPKTFRKLGMNIYQVNRNSISIILSYLNDRLFAWILLNHHNV